MKKLLKKSISICFILFSVCASVCLGQSLPSRPQGHVSDFANILSGQSRMRLESIGLELRQKTGVQIALVAIPSVQPYSIEQYATKLFETWGIGRKGKDNGILLLVALNDQQVRIEVGYGLEGIITDAVSRRIIERSILPAFRQGAYAEGFEAGTLTIANLIAQSFDVSIASTNHLPQQFDSYQKDSQEPSLFSEIFMFLIFIGMIILFIKNPRLFFYFLMLSMMGGRRGSGSGGGFGGGFGGFGGGISGGGGASGRW